MSNQQTTWVVVGTGAVGSVLAARLHQANHAVYIAQRQQQHDSQEAFVSLQLRGHTQGQHCIPTLPPYETCVDTLDLAQTIWVFPLKAWQLEPALVTYTNYLNHTPAIVMSHNGMGAASEWLHTWMHAQSQRRVYDWVTTHGSFRHDRYTTEHAGVGHSWLGVRGLVKSPAPYWLIDLEQAYPPFEWSEDIVLRRWLKLAINCIINPIASLHDQANAVLLEPQHQPLIQQLADEIADIMLASLETTSLTALKELVTSADKQFTQRQLAHFLVTQVHAVAQHTASNVNSMLQDIRAQRPTEIEFLNGFISRQAMQLGRQAPVNTSIYHAIVSKSSSV